jgi:hypothetical protein
MSRKRLVSRDRRLFRSRFIHALSLDQNPTFVRFGLLGTDMLCRAFRPGDVTCAIGIAVSVDASGVSRALHRCFLLRAQLFEGLLHGVRFEGAAVRGYSDTESLEFRDEVPIFHAELFG